MEKMLTLAIMHQEQTTANNFFCVSTMAQICNNSGNKIRPEYFELSQVHLHCLKATVQCPNQQRQHLKTFRIWKEELIMISNCSPTTGDIRDLGEWEHDCSAVIKISTVIHQSKDVLAIWCLVPRQWKVYTLIILQIIHF
jgi:hypothetical protein